MNFCLPVNLAKLWVMTSRNGPLLFTSVEQFIFIFPFILLLVYLKQYFEFNFNFIVLVFLML